MPYKDPKNPVKIQKQREAQARYREKNKDNEEVLARDREREKRYRPAYNEANKDHIRARRKRYAAANQDAIKEYQRTWRLANRGKKNAHERARDAARIKATPSWLSSFDILRTRCIYEVAAMRNRESDDSWHVDHIVPLKGKEVCGLHVPWNLRVIRAEENLRKGNRLETHI